MPKGLMAKLAAGQALFILPLVFFHALARSDVTPMGKAEQEALYSVIRGFVGDWWNGSELYPDPCGWTPIQGVSCDTFDGLWYITNLNIGPVLENSLECSEAAEFASSLFELKHLKSLSVYDCFSPHHPTGIPSHSWDKLALSLETLEFRSNQGLVGRIPSAIGRLANLQSLVLVQNSLTGDLPEELGNLVHLKRLTLAENGCSGQIPASIGNNLSELLILDLSRNSLASSLPPSIGSLTSLLKLDLSNNLLQGSLPSELGNLRNLTLLDLRNNTLSGGLIKSLQGMASLQDMLLANNPLGGDIMEFDWERLSNLTNLDLSFIGLVGSIPESIARMRRLRFLALDDNHLTGTVTSKLADLPCLSALYLSGNNFTGQLEFTEEFYQRMGRRFASWNNPSLCYRAGMVSKGNSPLGVEECKNEETSMSDSKNKLGVEKAGDDSGFMVSFGLQDHSISGFWLVILGQELVVVFLLVLVL